MGDKVAVFSLNLHTLAQKQVRQLPDLLLHLKFSDSECGDLELF